MLCLHVAWPPKTGISVQPQSSRLSFELRSGVFAQPAGSSSDHFVTQQSPKMSQIRMLPPLIWDAVTLIILSPLLASRSCAYPLLYADLNCSINMPCKDNNDGTTNLFGPLLTTRAGSNHTVQLHNELTAPVDDYLVGSPHRPYQATACHDCG